MPFPKGAAATALAGSKENESQIICGVCGKEIDVSGSEEYILGHCSKCNASPYHPECITELQARAETHNSKSREKQLVKAKHHPEQVFVRMKCPAGLFKGEDICSGKIVQADVVKPAKAAPLPPPALPVRGPRQPQPAATATGAAGAKMAPAPKKSQSMPRVVSNAGRTSNGLASGGSGSGGSAWQTASAGAKARLLGDPLARRQEVPGLPGLARSKSAPGSQGAGGSGAKNGMGASTLRFAPGQRPQELQLCKNWSEYDECRVYRCPYCHGKEELLEREKEYVAEQERQKREKRRQELEEHKRRQEEEARAAGTAGQSSVAGASSTAAWGTGARAGAAVLGGGGGAGGAGAAAVEAAFLQLSEAALSLMKEHKRRQCLNKLLEMGFGDSAEGAAKATGCDASQAVQLLMEGGTFAGAPKLPVDVTGEARTLLEAAAALGCSVADVELELVMAHGNWEAAGEVLEERAAGEAAQASRSSPESQSLPPSEWSEAPTPIPLSPTPSRAASLAGALPPGTTASTSPWAGAAGDGWGAGASSVTEEDAAAAAAAAAGAPKWVPSGPEGLLADLSAATESFHQQQLWDGLVASERSDGGGLAAAAGGWNYAEDLPPHLLARGAGGPVPAPAPVPAASLGPPPPLAPAAAPPAPSASEPLHESWPMGGLPQHLPSSAAATAAAGPATNLASAAGGGLGALPGSPLSPPLAVSAGGSLMGPPLGEVGLGSTSTSTSDSRSLFDLPPATPASAPAPAAISPFPGFDAVGSSLLPDFPGAGASTPLPAARFEAAGAGGGSGLGFDEGFRAGLAAAAAYQQQQQLQQQYAPHPPPASAAAGDYYQSLPGGYDATGDQNFVAGYAAAPGGGGYAAAAPAAAELCGGWGTLLGSNSAPAAAAPAAAVVPSPKGASLWGQLAPQPGAVADDEGELQDMLSLLCST